MGWTAKNIFRSTPLILSHTPPSSGHNISHRSKLLPQYLTQIPSSGHNISHRSTRFTR